MTLSTKGCMLPQSKGRDWIQKIPKRYDATRWFCCLRNTQVEFPPLFVRVEFLGHGWNKTFRSPMDGWEVVEYFIGIELHFLFSNVPFSPSPETGATGNSDEPEGGPVFRVSTPCSARGGSASKIISLSVYVWGPTRHVPCAHGEVHPCHRRAWNLVHQREEREREGTFFIVCLEV